MSELPSNPSDIRQCACVSDDARECMRIRYRNFESCEMDDTYDGWDDQECECGCHYERDEDYDESLC
jgi:hypothetical protein